MRIVDFNLSKDTPTDLYTSTIIMQGENLATKFVVALPFDMLGYKYVIALQLNNNTPFITSEIVPVDGVIEYTLTNVVTSDSGKLKVEIQAYNDEGLLMKTSTYKFTVKDSVENTTDVMPEAYVPWYTEVRDAIDEASGVIDEANALLGNITGGELTTVAQTLVEAINEVNAKPTGEANIDDLAVPSSAIVRTVIPILLENGFYSYSDGAFSSGTNWFHYKVTSNGQVDYIFEHPVNGQVRVLYYSSTSAYLGYALINTNQAFQLPLNCYRFILNVKKDGSVPSSSL